MNPDSVIPLLVLAFLLICVGLIAESDCRATVRRMDEKKPEKPNDEEQEGIVLREEDIGPGDRLDEGLITDDDGRGPLSGD